MDSNNSGVKQTPLRRVFLCLTPPQPKRCRHFAAKAKEKGATLARNPLFYLVELAESDTKY
nr:hypothetical protein [Cronobacter malonaticus]EGT4415085.1 hypothetical protein [Cronobacter malonaticus]